MFFGQTRSSAGQGLRGFVEWLEKEDAWGDFPVPDLSEDGGQYRVAFLVRDMVAYFAQFSLTVKTCSAQVISTRPIVLQTAYTTQVRAALGASVEQFSIDGRAHTGPVYDYRKKWGGKLPPIDRPEGVTLLNYDEEAEKNLPKDVIRYAGIACICGVHFPESSCVRATVRTLL